MEHLPVGLVNHGRMVVTDVERSKAFYTEVLGFEVAVDAPPPVEDEHHESIADSLQGGVVLMHQGMFFGLRPVDEERARSGDRFDPFRVGLDHFSFTVPTRADLDRAVEFLDERASHTVRSASSCPSACPSLPSSIRTASRWSSRRPWPTRASRATPTARSHRSGHRFRSLVRKSVTRTTGAGMLDE